MRNSCIRCQGGDAEIEIVGDMGKTKGYIHEECLIQNILSLIEIKPDYENFLRRLVQYEETTEGDKIDWVRSVTEGKKEVCWNWSDVGIPAVRLNKLVTANIATIIFSTRSRTDYTLIDRNVTKKVLELISRKQILSNTKTIKEPDIPGDLFDIVAGLEDIVKIVFKAIKGKSQVNILLIGPPSLGKSVILNEIERLPNSYMVFGGRVRKAGLEESIYKNIDPTQRTFLLVDELDKFSREDFSILLGLGEEGRLKTDVTGKHIDIRYDMRIFAACNDTSVIPAEVLSRFRKFHLPEYNKQQYIEVTKSILVKREGASEEIADFIGNEVYKRGFTDIRDAVGIFRLSENKEEVLENLMVMEKYKG